MTWARAIGEFGPILFFVGTEPSKGVLMPIRIYLDMSTRHIESAIPTVLIMLAIGTFALLAFFIAAPPTLSGGEKQRR